MREKAVNAVNQQGSEHIKRYVLRPSETTRRAPFSPKKGERIAYLLGALHDGTFSSNKRFRISQKGTEWLKVLKAIFKSLGYNAWIYKEGSDRKVYVIETLANFLDFRFNPSRIEKNDEKIGYVRGFFDAEGSIPHNHKKRFYIQLIQKDKEKLKKIKKILTELGIKTGKLHNPSYKVDPNYWRVYVLAESHKTFLTKIGSWHPKKVKILNKRMMI